MEYLKTLKEQLKKENIEKDYEITDILENDKFIVGITYGNDGFDCPRILIDKETGEKWLEFIPKTNIKDTKTIWENKEFKENSEVNDMSIETKIRKLLAQYGAEEQEIENFIQDLIDYKEDIEQIDEFQKDEKKGTQEYNDFAKTNNDNSDDKALKEMAKDEEKHDDYLFNAENVKLLKATKEGRDLIIKAPQMAKDELEKAIRDYLQKNK